MKNVTTTIAKAGIFFGTFIPAGALALSAQEGANEAQPAQTPGTLFGTGGIFKTISNVLIFLVGAISVIMLILGGLRYVTSTGDAGRVKQAKDTILYSIVGLVVAILAYAIVNFVTTNIK
ncbi:MAG TPA: hypothetical protein VLF21_00435 [Candidatus Saccharimonadales bacterium]|nr:hypothetical protein [Candidatus Saccharimonadales bacterium]